jgi:hypothetical protein
MAETWLKLAYEADVVTKALFAAESVLAATADDTPAALELAEQTLVGRLSGGDVAAISIGIADNNILQVDQADAADNEFARFTAAGLESLSVAETLAALSAGATSAFDWGGQDLTNGGVIFLTEQAAAEADVAGKGQIWVKTATPNELWFTDDAGTDFQLGLGGAHALLSATHSDTAAGDVTRGSLIYANDTPAWAELTVGAANAFLGADGTDVAWRTAADSMASLSGAAAAAFNLNGQQLQNHVLHVVADAAGRPDPVVGKICWQTDELAIYVCTVAA